MQVLHLGRRMLLDQVDAVRRSAAEQLMMAARIDLDRCPARLLHHIQGACSRQSGLPRLSSSVPPPPPPPVPLEAAAAALEGGAGVPTGGSVVEPESTGLDKTEGKGNGQGHDAAPVSAAGSEAAGGKDLPQAGASSSALGRENDGFVAADVVTATGTGAGTPPCPVGRDGEYGEDSDDRLDRGVAEDRDPLEEPMPMDGLVAAVAAAAAEGEASPPSPSTSPPRGAVQSAGAGGAGAGGGGEEGRVLVEPLDRAGSCGLWLRLVILPLVVECLEGSYRSKLLALHMMQVGHEG